ncbi:rhodanese-like domain-containing protein [Pontibacter sp. JH31]|uniref:Rhodanese-like domain-containing protein n=1 Tax=Pontibacter aquaedesilientis TaxID=2766980 RepID=A0ABR7XDW6_9BACT|nr:rhodanese-like domain-containing protein [Pontibacter aquaedesilientis]MBD1395561.1 rhodanese-like domain-containing protein [Pontibacter aquaedesilientis]
MPKSLYLIGFLCLLLQACGATTDKAYELMLKGMYSDTVETITPTELQAATHQPNQPVLLDTRSEAEFLVSHLAGARLVAYESFDLSQLKDVPKNTPIVVYCSVGYRSEKIGEKLQEAGYTQVQNLYGGIFEWVNQGHPVFNRQGETDRVHAYSRAWGIWLRKGEKVYD